MTTEEIYNEIIGEKESGNYPDLDELDSTSLVAVWRLMIWIFAFFSKTIRELFDSFQSYTESIFAKNQVGTLPWWIEQIKAFQYGDQLIFTDGIYKYPVIDPEKQIIKQAALETVNYVLIFKAVSEDSNGDLIPITNDAKTALLAYINKIKMPGTYVSVVSENADDLKCNYKIYYNAEKNKNDIEALIISAVNDYIKNIIYNGKFSHTELTDHLQSVSGVINPVYISGYGKSHAASSADYIEITDYYTAASGYFQIAELNLEFVAYV